MTLVTPPLADWLLRAVLPPADVDAVMGDLHEGFATRVTQLGIHAARRWYWRQVRRSLVPSARRRWFPSPLTPPSKGPLMAGFWADVRFNVRAAIRRPLVASVAVLSLTIGIAMTTVVFSLLDAAILRPLPVESPADLSLITEQRATSINRTLPYADFQDWNAGQQAFTGMLASSIVQVAIQFTGDTSVVDGEAVSGSYFETLGVGAQAGRVLVNDDDRSGAAPVVVVSKRVWERLGGAGRPFTRTPITINNMAFTAVGIAPDRFAGIHVGERAQVWVPLAAMGAADPGRVGRALTSRGTSWLWLMGRRRPGVTHETAAAELNRVEAGVAASVGRPTPKVLGVTDGRRGTDRVPESSAQTLRVLLAAAALVLLIACANVANLLLARGADRRRELQVRTALGAGRWRLIRLLATDAVITALAAGVMGVMIAWPAARLAASMVALFGTPMELDVLLDWRTAGVGIGLGLVSALLASLAPAVHVMVAFRGSSNDAGTRAVSAGRAATRLRQVLLVAQFAMVLALVTTAGLLLRTVENLRSMPAGFDTNRLALISVDAGVTALTGPQVLSYVEEAIRRLAAVPGVEAVGFARIIPVGFGGQRRTVEIPGYQPAPDEDMELNCNLVAGDYFTAMGIPVVQGRGLTSADIGTPVVVVNETMARQYWPDAQAVGRTIGTGGPDPVRIVGVVRDAKYRMLREEARPSFYLPAEAPTMRFGAFHVRTATSPDAVLHTLRTVVTEVNPAIPVTDVRTLRSQADANINDDRVAMMIGMSLAGAALILSAVGLFGSMTYLVTQRTRELGIRVALGADGARIHRLVLRQGLGLALGGAALGLLVSIWTTRAVESRLVGVTALDPASFVTAALVLTSVALIATWLPARRAARLDPINALRDE